LTEFAFVLVSLSISTTNGGVSVGTEFGTNGSLNTVELRARRKKTSFRRISANSVSRTNDIGASEFSFINTLVLRTRGSDALFGLGLTGLRRRTNGSFTEVNVGDGAFVLTGNSDTSVESASSLTKSTFVEVSLSIGSTNGFGSVGTNKVTSSGEANGEESQENSKVFHF